MKLHELIKALEELPDEMKDSDILMEYGATLKTRRVRSADHFHLFCLDGQVTDALLDSLPKIHKISPPRYQNRPTAI